jgi:NTP pyrophosphatase (non-canonical NTP hydrolase)
MDPSEYTCPVHPQCQVWRHREERGGQVSVMERCAICGRLLAPPGADPKDYHPFGVPDGALKPGEQPVFRTFAVYRRAVDRTDPGEGQEGHFPLEYHAGCLCEEAGEFYGKVKKLVYHRHEATHELKARMVEELGDALWYLDRCAQRIGVTLEEVAAGNIAKLRERYPDGYSHAASANRTVPFCIGCGRNLGTIHESTCWVWLNKRSGTALAVQPGDCQHSTGAPP